MFQSARTLKLFLFSLGFVALLLDQATKFLIKKVPENGIFLFNTPIISLKLQLAHNPFIAFSLPVARPLILILSLVIFAFLIFYIQKNFRNKKLFLSLVLMLIFSAALSNFIDRLFVKNVIDFISITIYNYSWPIFNLADTIIVLAAIMLLIYEFKKPKENL